ncbi:MAG: hypothetical protein GY771_06715 [bacterium]|nr:hypothetical protein [bacterium]
MSKNVKFDIRAADKTKTAFKSVRSGLKGVTGSLTSMKGLLIGGGVIAGLGLLTKGIKDVTSAAMTQREAETQLEAVLKATGHAAGFNLEQLKSMASGLQDVTTYGDETTLAGMSILATFKNIRGEAFERTTKAALDMSTVMKQDLKSSMVMLGKAINDPVKNLSALSRAGVQFTDKQRDMIKELVEAGDLFEAQNIILKELESQFGGAAEAAGGPFAKALGQLKNAWGDLMEEIGFAITDNEAFVEILNKLKELIISWIPMVAELADRFMDWIGPIDQLNDKISVFTQSLQVAVDIARGAIAVFAKVGEVIGVGAAAAYTVGENIMKGDPFAALPSFDTGTGPEGLPNTGLHM